MVTEGQVMTTRSGYGSGSMRPTAMVPGNDPENTMGGRNPPEPSLRRTTPPSADQPTRSGNPSASRSATTIASTEVEVAISVGASNLPPHRPRKSAIPGGSKPPDTTSGQPSRSKSAIATPSGRL